MTNKGDEIAGAELGVHPSVLSGQGEVCDDFSMDLNYAQLFSVEEREAVLKRVFGRNYQFYLGCFGNGSFVPDSSRSEPVLESFSSEGLFSDVPEDSPFSQLLNYQRLIEDSYKKIVELEFKLDDLQKMYQGAVEPREFFNKVFYVLLKLEEKKNSPGSRDDEQLMNFIKSELTRIISEVNAWIKAFIKTYDLPITELSVSGIMLSKDPTITDYFGNFVTVFKRAIDETGTEIEKLGKEAKQNLSAFESYNRKFFSLMESCGVEINDFVCRFFEIRKDICDHLTYLINE